MGLSYTSMLAKMASLSSSLEGNVYINRSKTWRNTNADMSDLIVVKKTLEKLGYVVLRERWRHSRGICWSGRCPNIWDYHLVPPSNYPWQSCYWRIYECEILRHSWRSPRFGNFLLIDLIPLHTFFLYYLWCRPLSWGAPVWPSWSLYCLGRTPLENWRLFLLSMCDLNSFAYWRPFIYGLHPPLLLHNHQLL